MSKLQIVRHIKKYTIITRNENYHEVYIIKTKDDLMLQIDYKL